VEVPEKPRLIAGRYELESLIGEGGMASVWRARDLTLERAVAVKLLYARDERDKEALVRQFVREARIAASVQHRNVIHIVDFGTTDEQQPYMVMELLEGESLAQRLQSERRLRMEELVHVASLTLRGLEAVHEAGIVHRDLKPDNIYPCSPRFWTSASRGAWNRAAAGARH
jgi:serine/threonine-protein kinase